jgi:hypothetical protein
MIYKNDFIDYNLGLGCLNEVFKAVLYIVKFRKTCKSTLSSYKAKPLNN